VRLALVYTSPLPDAVRTAAVVARATGAEVVVRNGLGELSGTEADAQVRARVSDELEAIGDLHRGETVLVVSHADALRTAVPGEHDWAVGAVVELAMDADGWVVRGGTGATTRPKPIQNA
jgi:broad specificity phosphatase PhoE